MFGMRKNSSGNQSQSDSINIYWAPLINGNGLEQSNKNIFYKNPINLFSDLYDQRNDEVLKGDSFFSCPVFSKKIKNTYVFESPTENTFEFEDDKVYFKNSPTQYMTDLSVKRKSPIKESSIFYYDAQWIFFAEESLIASFTQPYFHDVSYAKESALFTGESDIGQWFRPFNIELITRKPKGTISILKEPLFYVEFKTDKKINLIRFNWNRPLESLKNSCASNANIGYPKKSIEYRQKDFIESSTRELVLKEIKKEIL